MSNLNFLYARPGGEEGSFGWSAYIEALKTLPGAQRLRSLYPEDLSKYELRMTEFSAPYFGGPALYQERHGHAHAEESHRSFAIDGEARDEWMLCMRMALRETVSDEELRLYLEGAFWRMADSLRTGREKPPFRRLLLFHEKDESKARRKPCGPKSHLERFAGTKLSSPHRDLRRTRISS